MFEIIRIAYNESFDPKLFTIDLPQNVVRALPAEQMARIEQAVLAVRWEPARDRFDAPVSGVVRLVIRVE